MAEVAFLGFCCCAFSIPLLVHTRVEKLPQARPVSHLIANQKARRKSPQASGFRFGAGNQKPRQTSSPGSTPRPPRISCHMRLV